MYRKRVLGVIAAVIAVTALVTAGAGFATLMRGASGPTTVEISKAAAKQMLQARIAHARALAKQLATSQGVVRYLRSRGFDPSKFVVQRGKHNYAGPNCPGKRWNCTRAHHVVQFDSGEGDNSFTCSPSYGTPTVDPNPFPGETRMAPNTCVIVQVNAGDDNKAVCIERSSDPDVTQTCDVYQQNTTGNNRSKIIQVIEHHDGQTQDGKQRATLDQENKLGKNDSDLSQLIRQFTSASGPSAHPVNQDQKGDQQSSVEQNAESGKQISSLAQRVLQIARAGTENGERDRAARFSADEGGPVSGNQTQHGDGNAKVDQNSSGVSTSDNFQSIRQFEYAPDNSTQLKQTQIGPVGCCTFQQNNPAAKFNLKQVKVQFASTASPNGESSTFATPFQVCEGGPCTANQHLSANGELESSGAVHIEQIGIQDGIAVRNSCDASGNPQGNACTATIQCTNGICGPAMRCSTDNGQCCIPPQGERCFGTGTTTFRPVARRN